MTLRARLTPDSWIARPKPNPHAVLRLFCFPYAGAGASIFRSWPEYLPTAVEVCAIQLPGRWTRMREPPFSDLTSLVQAAAIAFRPVIDRPFAFFGHSLGALIAFELARKLRETGDPQPVHIFLSSYRAPQLPTCCDRIHALATPEFALKLRALHYTPEKILMDEELMELVLPALRADFSLLEGYHYVEETPLDYPLSVFGASLDSLVRREQLEDWSHHTTASFSLTMFPGDHFYIHNYKHLLLQTLSSELTWIVKRISNRQFVHYTNGSTAIATAPIV